ncbi:MAG: hypothetical protein IJZ61_00055 [Oscillospiraceae bacterium]|nr:hypothetical protein [Oscillospiraceae bacterium]
MKRLLSALAALAVCASLTACGSNDDSSAAETTAADTTTVTTAAPDETVSEESTETQNETSTAAEDTAAETETSAVTDITAEETTAETTTFTELSEATTTSAETEETIASVPDAPASDEEIIIDDSADDMAVSSSFADMDEFLSSDIFMLDGKTVSADKALSANIFNTLKGDFYFEGSDFDGSSPFKLAVKGNMIMTETKADGRTNKSVIRDSKVYTLDHEKMIALFIPADKTLTSQYTPEQLGIIPENISKESFVIADVTIGGKAYKLEYGTTSGWAMLYDASGKLYASLKNGDSLDLTLCKFSVTSKIPSGTFDIPEDYLQLDLEEMLQNGPPPEEME